jgi:hypothetical protein
MPRLFSHGAAMSMTRSALALGLLLVVSATGATPMAISAARAEDAAPTGCTLAAASFLSQPDQGDVTINCTGLSEAIGKQLTEIMTRILQHRLDPQSVLAKLDEVARVPQEGVARTVDEKQRHLIIQSLIGKPAEQIAITAHLSVEDSAEYAKALAAPLMMVGWQIEGHQIRRAAPKSLDPVQGLAVVVRDRGAAPQKALQLKAALAAAQIGAALVSDPALAPDATLLWVGRRVVFSPAEPAR